MTKSKPAQKPLPDTKVLHSVAAATYRSPKSKKSPTKPTALPKDQLVAIIKRLESGQTLVINESKKLGFKHNPQLRKALTEFLGGKAKYNAMLARAVKARGGKKNGKKENGKNATA